MRVLIVAGVVAVLGGAAEAKPAAKLTARAFDQLTNRQKMRTLVKGYDKLVPGENWVFEFKPGFSVAPVRLKTALRGTVRNKALKLYGIDKRESAKWGADSFDVNVIKHKGTTFA